MEALYCLSPILKINPPMMEGSTVFSIVIFLLDENVAILAKTLASKAASIGMAVVTLATSTPFKISNNLLYSTAMPSKISNLLFSNNNWKRLLVTALTEAKTSKTTSFLVSVTISGFWMKELNSEFDCIVDAINAISALTSEATLFESAISKIAFG